MMSSAWFCPVPGFVCVAVVAPVFSLHAAVEPRDEVALHAAVKTPQGRHALVVAELRRVLGEGAFSKLSSAPETRWFMQDLLASKERMADLMLSGPLEDPAKSIRILARIWKEAPGGLGKREEQTTAAAVALMFAKDKWPEDQGAVDRYKYFRDSRLAGKLHPMFDTLDTWEKRHVVSAGGNGGWADSGGWGDASLVWLRDNVKLPAKDYTDACWQAPYKLNNLFGDSIHGANYYAPFTTVTHAERVRDVGGVCGSLSHYGANAARANGIPALTMGEPGHCAYAVRVSRGEWEPAYTLSWERGLHTSLWGNTWTQLILQEKTFDDKAAQDLCMLHVFQARSLKAKNPELAELAYAAALEAQPINFTAWCESVDFLRDQWKPSPESWEIIGKSVCTALAAYPETAWEVLSRIDDAALKVLPEDRRMTFLLKYHELIAKQNGPAMWHYEKALDAQAAALGAEGGHDLEFFEKVLAIQSGSKSWFAPTIAWGQKRFSGNAEATKSFFAVLGRVFSSASSGDNQEGMKAALGPAILAAEAADNVDAFQSLGKAGAAFRKAGQSQVEPFPGDLLSSGGLLKTSSTSQYDSPVNHWGVIEADGGSFHTDKQVRPYAVVRLGKLGDLSGIVVTGTDYGQNGPRQMPLKVSVSADGTAWQEVFRTTEVRGPWRIPLSGKATRVQFVKVERDDDRNEFFHLGGIRAYGRRLQ